MAYKKWLLVFFLSIICFIVPTVSYLMYNNYKIDPLWNFTHANAYNSVQIGFDERQQKANYMVNHPVNYDSLLLGTSRVTYMNEQTFKKNDVYNFSVSALASAEYAAFADFAVKQHSKPFKHVYAEAYFSMFDSVVPATEPSVYFDKATNPLYRFTSLFSASTTERAQANKAYSLQQNYQGPRVYNRHNIATAHIDNSQLLASLDDLPALVASKKYVYDENFMRSMQEFKQRVAPSDLTIFVAPMLADRLKLTLQDDTNWQHFTRWFTELITVFGEVQSFQLINDYTSNYDLWFDTLHYYPKFGDVMIEQLEAPEKNPTICFTVTAATLDKYFALLAQQVGR